MVIIDQCFDVSLVLSDAKIQSKQHHISTKQNKTKQTNKKNKTKPVIKMTEIIFKGFKVWTVSKENK